MGDIGEPAVEQESGEFQKEQTPAEMPSVRFGPLDQVLGRKGAPPAIPASAMAESPSSVPVAAQSATVVGTAGFTALVAPTVRDRVPVLETPASPLPKLRGVSEEFPMGRLLLSAEKNKRPRSEVGDEEAPAWKRLREVPPKRQEGATPVSCGVPIQAMEPAAGEGAEAILSQVKGVALGVEQQYPGTRVQIHKLGDCLVVYGPDNVHLIPSLGDASIVALRAALRCKACVLDATLLYDFAEATGGATGEPFFVASDCLWFDGRPLIGQTLRARRTALEGIVKQGCDILQLAPQETFTVDDPPTDQSVTPLLEEAKTCGCEGLLFKRLDGMYETGSTSASWLALGV